MSAGAVIAVSAHGGVTDLIHACVGRDSGTLHIVGSHDSCRVSKVALDWNNRSPKGDKGDTGSQAPQGVPPVDMHRPLLPMSVY